MKDVTFVVSKIRLAMLAIVLSVTIFLSLYSPKNEESNKMIVEFNSGAKCELLLWNDDELVARLYSKDSEKCKFYLIKNFSR